MLGNFIQETTVAPGTSAAVNLAGAPVGRRPFSSQFASGARCFYGMDDGTQAEAGYGTFTSGSPNTFSRDTVLWNSAGTTVRLNFTGTVRIYNDVPAERFVYRDAADKVALPGDLAVAGNSAVTGNLTVAGSSTVTGNSTVVASVTVGGTMTSAVSVTGGATGTDPAGTGVVGAILHQTLSIYSLGSGGTLRVANGGSPTGLLCAWFNGIGGLVGTITTNGATTAYNTTSDYRLKDNIQDLTGGLDIVMNLRPRSFVYRSQPDVRTYGFIADEFASAAPLAQAVNGSKDAVDKDGKPIYQGMDYGKPTPLLAAAIQDLKRQTDTVIAALTARIAALEAKLP